MFRSCIRKRLGLRVVSWTMVTAVTLLVIVPSATADLLNPTAVKDTPTNFLGVVDDTALTVAIVRGGLVNWDVAVVQDNFDGGLVADDIVVWGQHLVAPHAGEAAPNPAIVIGAFQNVVPGAAVARVFRNSVTHPDHFNNMVLTYRRLGAAKSRLIVDISHADEAGQTDALPFTVDPEPPDLPDPLMWSDSIPTVSEWGLMAMTLLVLTAGTVVLGRRRRRAAA